jgi:hypothetical protein
MTNSNSPNLNTLPLAQQAQSTDTPLSGQMAFQRADPAPFLPPQMQLQHTKNYQFMVRAVAGSPLVPRHEDWAIITIHPQPGNVLNFNAVKEVLDYFFADVARVQTRSIQRSHLGQALVQFARVYGRDTLIANSPHQFDNMQISFVRHNQGCNWRHVTFNREV